MIYLITCAGSKITPVIQKPSTLELLSFSQTLNQARQKLLVLTEIDLDWNLTLPAWQLYSGNRSRIYPRITVANWTKDCIDIRILSALFGWIKHTDLLPYYDLKMTDIIPHINQSIHRYWNNQHLLNINKFVKPTDVDLLSGNYRKAIHGNTNPIAVLPNIQFTDRGDQKGIWLNNELTNTICN